jgi:hypothetical protein
MYVQITAELRDHINRTLNTQLNDAFAKWQAGFIIKHQNLGWKLLNHILPGEYNEFWAIYDKLHKGLTAKNSNYYSAQSHNQMTINTELDTLKGINIPLSPSVRCLYGMNLSHYVPAGTMFSMKEILVVAPEVANDFDVLREMNHDHKVLRDAAYAALGRSSLAVALKDAPFLRDLVPGEYLQQLAAKAEPKVREVKAAPDPVTEEAKEALLIASTRLKIQN